MKQTPMLSSYIELSKNSIDEKGIYPSHAVVTRDGKTNMLALALDPEQSYETVRQQAGEDYTELLFGLDRHNAEDQGVDMKYKSVFTFAHYVDGEWSYGVLPYNDKSSIGEILWENDFWTKTMQRELKLFGFIDPDESDKIIGNAYVNKLHVTHIRNSQTGQKYEGTVNVANLSPDVQDFLQENNLNINDRTSTCKWFAERGVQFEFSREDMGFWTLKAAGGIFPARSSRSKAYIEGVEVATRKLIKSKISQI